MSEGVLALLPAGPKLRAALRSQEPLDVPGGHQLFGKLVPLALLTAYFINQ